MLIKSFSKYSVSVHTYGGVGNFTMVASRPRYDLWCFWWDVKPCSAQLNYGRV